ncbi:MAG TPA: 30S ribosomal protein S12 methylthiotransferase RimO [Bacteroidota bacterium]|jgi:ribosomal protein S12 methylthiotransferase
MDGKKRKINIVTLGCSKNVVDSEELMSQLRHNGLELTSETGETDTAIINTCGFIEAAKQESIDSILEAVELKKSGVIRKVVVMGCLSERYADELRREIPEVDVFVGANKIDQAVRAAGGDYKHELLGERMLTTPRHFAYLKISEGCDRPCSFCAIPLMRGAHKSKPRERVLLEAQRLAALGVKEIVLIAQDSTYYGLDLYGKRTLAGLLDSIAGVKGIEWIRLLYAFPAGFPADVLECFNAHPNICRSLDIPIQHISDPVLSSMRRGISTLKLRELLAGIRSAVPGIALRTTLIVGYPAEGEREFEELLEFVREGHFDRMGVFTYSQEEGTTAHPLGDPVPQSVKEARRDAVMEAQREISRERNERLVGRTLKVLIDSAEGGTAAGRTEWDAPEVDNEVIVEDAAGFSAGEFYDVTIVGSEAYDLFAVPGGKA